MPIYQLGPDIRFPSPELADEDGILAVGGDLSIERLVQAYASGIFPWYSEGQPILWWSPDPRTVLLPENFHIPKRLARTIRSSTLRLSCNKAFRKVITQCASVPRGKQSGTWITQEMIDAYCALHEEGWACSWEAWNSDELVAGVYGVVLGNALFAESMFHAQRDASKVLLCRLAESLFHQGFHFIDAQVYNNHLGQFGFQQIPRSRYLSLLQKITSESPKPDA